MTSDTGTREDGLHIAHEIDFFGSAGSAGEGQTDYNTHHDKVTHLFV
jgi:hypothetical protein